MYHRDPVVITPKEPPGLAEFIHHGIGVWWVLLIGGILVA